MIYFLLIKTSCFFWHNKTSNFPEQTADAFCWLFMLIGNPFSLTGLATKLLLIQFHFVDEYMCSSII